MKTHVQDNPIDIEEAAVLYQRLHQFPDKSSEEQGTAGRLKQYLSEYSPTRLVDQVGGYGIIAEWQGSLPGPTIMVRCTMDALRISESTDLPFASLNEGLTHANGSDGQMAIVASLAQYFSVNPPEKGAVALLFQPAKETGEGAQRVVLDDKIHLSKPDYIIGFQNVPGVELGTVLVREGVICSGSKGIEVQLEGEPGSAYNSDQGIDPTAGMIRLMEQIQDLSEQKNYDAYVDARVVSNELIGGGFNSAPYRADVRASLRAYIKRELDKISKRVVDQAQIIGHIHQLKVSVSWHNAFEPVKNEEDSSILLFKAAKATDLRTEVMEEPFKWSDDFGVYLKKYSGVFFGLGSGLEVSGLHRPDYQFPEELFPVATKLLLELIQQAQASYSS